MKNFDYMIPVLGDAISGAFGGAVVGNAFGNKTTAIVCALVGSVILIFFSLKKDKKQSPKKVL